MTRTDDRLREARYSGSGTKHPTELLRRATAWATQAGIEFEDISVARPSLEDVYLALTGQPREDSETEASKS